MTTSSSLLPADADLDLRKRARALYWAGWRVSRIGERLDVKTQTVFSWKYRDEWDKYDPIDRIDETLETRLIQLIAKDAKEGKDYKEIDLLTRQMERTARLKNRFAESDPDAKAARGKRAGKNAFSEEETEKLVAAFHEALFDYQKEWFAAGEKQRLRNILKSRQIGATWYFAREALVDALQTGRNQIFLSASKAQAHVFKQYIMQFAKDAVGVELSGSPIVLDNGAHLYFLGTSARTAQSYHGNLYLDEYFWIQRFQEFRKVVSGMAIHSCWRQTYFSTPSSMSHEAYPFWTGALFNKGRKEKVEIDTSHAALQAGRRCADGQWRQIVTVEDAVAGGCALFDLDQLRLEYSPDEYGNLLMCLFIDDSASIFPLALLMRAMVDTWEKWGDFRPFYSRPYGDGEVWLGYDPSVSRDSAALVVVAAPESPGGKFRLLERHQFRGLDFQAQADRIEAMLARYRVAYIGIDVTGVGQGVYQLVRQFYPAAEPIRYSVDLKMAMVLKALDVMNKGRLEFDAGWTDMAQSFMAVRRTVTESGRQVTFRSDRSEEISHSDLAWATMHALAHEPLEADRPGVGAARMEIFG
jgi:uncharacterized protein YjcR